jgi:hypothetical protein
MHYNYFDFANAPPDIHGNLSFLPHQTNKSGATWVIFILLTNNIKHGFQPGCGVFFPLTMWQQDFRLLFDKYGVNVAALP